MYFRQTSLSTEELGAPDGVVFDRSSEKFCKETVQKKLDEDVGSFKAALLPHWKEDFLSLWTQEAGDIDDERDLFTWMLSKNKFFVSAAAVDFWMNVRLCTGFLSLMFCLFYSDSFRFHLRVQKSIKKKAIGDCDKCCQS